MKSTTWRRWLSRLFNEFPIRRGVSGRGTVQVRARPFVEPLEDRVTPATTTWTGNAGTPNWSAPGNWSTTSPGGIPAPGDDLVFPFNSNAMNRVTNNDLSSLQVNSITVSGSDYTLDGNQITLGSALGGNSLIVGAAAQRNIIDLDLRMGGSNGSRQFFIVNSGGDLAITGRLRDFSGSTSPGELVKDGTGLLLLGGDNRTAGGYSGPITVSQGIMQISHALALGTPGNGTTVQQNAELQLVGINGTIDEPLLLNGFGNSTGGALNHVSGTTVWSGNIRIDTDVSIGAGSPVGLNNDELVISGVISDTGAGHSITKVGLGLVIFSNANTYRGLTTVATGMLTIRNPQALGPATNTPQSGTVVSSSPTLGFATLKIDAGNAPGSGFLVHNEQLTLNGSGLAPAVKVTNVGNDFTVRFVDGLSAVNVPQMNIRPLFPPAVPVPPVFTTLAVNTLLDGSADSQTSEIQTVRVVGTQGFFEIFGTFEGQGFATAPLPFNATSAEIEAALTAALAPFGPGALTNARGNNTWSGTVTLGSPTPNGSNVVISSEVTASSAATNLTISGVVQNQTTNEVVGATNSTALTPIIITTGTNHNLVTGQTVEIKGVRGNLTANGFFTITVIDLTRFSLNGTAGSPPTGVYAGGGTWTPMFSLTKVRSGRLTFNNSNTYTSATTVARGILKIQDSQSLGPVFQAAVPNTLPPISNGSLGTTVNTGAALEMEVDTGFDANGRDLSIDSREGTTGNGPQLGLTSEETLTIAGRGILENPALPFNALTNPFTGALRSISGINQWIVNITLAGGPTGIGVDTIQFESNTNLYFTNDYSLTATSISGGAAFQKLGGGHLILPNSNAYTGTTSIERGWITVQDNLSLGSPINDGRPDSLQPGTTVRDGAALHLKPKTPGDSFDLLENLTLTGNGIAHPFQLINQKGSLMSLGGVNSIGGLVNGVTGARTSDIFLDGVGSIGVEALDPEVQIITATGVGPFTLTFDGDSTAPLAFNSSALVVENALNALPSIFERGGAVSVSKAGNTYTVIFTGQLNSVDLSTIQATPSANASVTTLQDGAGLLTSELTITSTIFDFTDPLTGVVNPGGINKFGSRRLNLRGEGYYTADNNVFEGLLRAQHNTALGLASSGTGNGTQTYTNTTTSVGPGIAELQALTLSGAQGRFTLTFTNSLGLSSTTVPIQVTTASTLRTTVRDALNALPSIQQMGGDVTVEYSGNILTVSFGGGLVGLDQLPLTAVDPDNGGTLVVVTTIVEGDGSALELHSTARMNDGRTTTAGGLTTGLEIWNEQLILDSPGNRQYRNTNYLVDPLTVLSNDNLWRGPVVLQRDAIMLIPDSARLILFGSISDDLATGRATTSDLTIHGGGTVELIGVNDYDGTTTIEEGTLVIRNSQALGDTGVAEIQTVVISGTPGTFTLSFNGQPTGPLNTASPTLASDMQTALNNLLSVSGRGGSMSVTGSAGVYLVTFNGNFFGYDQPTLLAATSPGTNVTVATSVQGDGGTIVADGAALELQGSLTVAGEPLILSGRGAAEATSTPVGWFAEGPATINGGETPGFNAVAGRVSAIAVDPRDANIIYIAAAGGGVWKTKDGGVHWEPLFDQQTGSNERQSLSVSGLAGSFTLEFTNAAGLVSTTIELPANATARDIQEALNDLPSIGGVGGSVTVTQTTGGFVTNASNTTPITITSAVPHNLTTGETVQISGVQGNTAANGIFTVTVLSPTTYRLDGSTGNGTYPPTGVTPVPPPGYWSPLQNSFTIAFQGNLAGADQLPLVVNPTGLTTNITTVSDGIPAVAVMNVGAIAIDTRDTRNIYIGTGETNNSADSFYGTGLYRSTDSGRNWTLVTGPGGVNPFDRKGISKIVVDTHPFAPGSPANPTLWVSMGDGGTGSNEVQTVRPLVANGTTFQLRFTGPNAAGTVVTTVTAPITHNPGNLAQEALDIQNALNALANIGGVGGFVTVTPPTNPPPVTFTVTFGGTLSQIDVQQIQESPVNSFTVNTTTVRDGGGGAVVNGSGGNVGVWRYMGGVWFNATNQVISTNRLTVPSGATQFPANGAPGITVPGAPFPDPPMTAGPDDNYLVTFPRNNATWSDVSLVYTDIDNNPNNGIQSDPVIYAALGTAGGSPDIQLNNGVFFCINPYSASPIWYAGDPQAGTIFAPIPQNAVTAVDARGQSNQLMFPLGRFPVVVNNVFFPGIPRNGNIKISTVAGNFLNTTTIYASVSDPAQNHSVRSFTRDVDGRVITVPGTNIGPSVLKSVTGGQSWQFLSTSSPTGPAVNYMFTEGESGNAIYAMPVPRGAAANTVTVGGFESDPLTHLGHLLQSVAGGNAGTWNDIGVSPTSGPHTGFHAITTNVNPFNPPAAGTVVPMYVATDGGVWRRDVTGTWTDISGNLAISQINSVASHPTDLRLSYAGTQHNGLNVFQNDLAWNMLDTNPVIGGGGAVRVDPSNPNILYHIQQRAGLSALVRKSTNAGLSWNTIHNTNFITAPLALDTVNPLRLLVGGTGLFQTLNGSTFTPVANLPAGLGNNVTALGIASFQGNFLLDPEFLQVADRGSNTYDPATIYVTNGTSIFVTKNSGQSWSVDRTIGSPLEGLGGIVDIVVDPRNRDTVYVVRSRFGGSQVFKTTDAGRSWTDLTGGNNLAQTFAASGTEINRTYPPVGSGGLEGGTLVVVWPTAPAENLDTITSFVDVTGLTSAITDVDVRVSITHPFDIDTSIRLVAPDGTTYNLTVTNGGNNPDGYFNTTFDSQAANSITAATAPFTGSFRPEDDLSGLNGMLPAVANGRWYLQVNDSFGGGTGTLLSWSIVIRSSTGTPLLPDNPAWKVVLDPRTEDLYLGTDQGVYVLRQALTSRWERFGTGLPNVQVRDLELNFSTNTLLAGTYGRGVYRLFLNNPVPNAGALRAVSGSSVWTGPIQMLGNTSSNEVIIAAEGTQSLQNGLAPASLNLVGAITDFNPGAGPRVVKLGAGDVILSGANSYTGVTDVREGVLVVRHPKALGDSGDPSSRTSEQQAVTITGTSGVFNLTFGGNTTVDLPFNATAAAVQAALNALPSIGGVGGAVTVAERSTGYLVTFDGTLAFLNLPLLLPDMSGLAVVSEVRPGGEFSGTIVRPNAALELASDLEAEPVLISGDGIRPAFNGHFTGALRNVTNTNTYTGPLTLGTDTTIGVDSGSSLTIGGKFGLNGIGTIRDGGNEVQTVTVTGTTGVFNLAFGVDTTVDLPFNATAQQVQDALNALPSINSGGGVVSVVQVRPNVYQVTFGGTLAGLDLPVLVPGGSAVAFATTLDNGGGTTARNIRKELLGTLVLASANDFDGKMSIVQGAVRIEDSRALGKTVNPGTANATYVLDGAQLQIQSLAVDPITGLVINRPVVVEDEPLFLTGTGISGTGALLNTRTGNFPSNNAWRGPITLVSFPNFSPSTLPGGTVSIGVSDIRDTLSIETSISETLPLGFEMLRGYVLPEDLAVATGLAKVGPGTVVLTQGNTHTGGTYVAAGSLRVRHAGALGLQASEQQLITVSGAGTFNLMYLGETTMDLPVGATPLDVQNELNALTTISGVGGSVTVMQLGSGAYLVTFGGTLANNNQQTFIAGGSATTTIQTVQQGANGTAINEIQRVSVSVPTIPAVAGEFFRITFRGFTTAPLPYGLQASGGVGVTASVRNAILDLLTNTSNLGIDGADVTVVRHVLDADRSTGAPTIYAYTITFGGTIAGVDQPLMSAFGGNGASASASAVSEGQMGTVVFDGATLEVDGDPLGVDAMLNIPEAIGLSGQGLRSTEEQVITVAGTSGLYNLTFRGATTNDLPFNATAGDIQIELNALSSIAGVGGSVLVAQTAPGVFRVTFGGSLGVGDQPQIQAAGTAGAVATTSTEGSYGALRNVSGTRNVWSGSVVLMNDAAIGVKAGTELTLAGGSDPEDVQDYRLVSEQQLVTVTGAGTFNLTFRGETTGNLPITATALQVRNALNALPSIGGVGGSVFVNRLNTGIFRITFMGTLAGQDLQPLIPGGSATTVVSTAQDYRPVPRDTGDGTLVASLTKVEAGILHLPSRNTYSGQTFVDDGILNVADPSSLGDVVRSGPEIQQVTVLGASGTFTLRFRGFTTVALDILSGTLAADIETALNALPSVAGPGGFVTVTRGAIPFDTQYTVTFGGNLSLDNLPKMTSVGSPGVSAIVSELRDGPDSTTVRSGGTLRLSNGQTWVTEALTLNGLGFNNFGALESDAGDNTWRRTITLATDSSIGVKNAGQQLLVDAAIVDNGLARGLTKIGPGTLEFFGIADNTYTGLTQVNDGVLELNKVAATEVQTVTVVGVAGTFNLRFRTGAGSQTIQLPYNVTAANLEAALNNLSTISNGGTGFVTVTQTVATTARQEYQVTFGGALAGSIQPLMVAVGNAGATASVTTTTDGTTGNAIAGDIRIGDTLPGGTTDAILRWVGVDNQVVNNSDITVENDGLLDLNLRTEAVDALTLNDGIATTGSGVGTGTLTVNSLNMVGGTIILDTVTSSLQLQGGVTATSSALSEANIQGDGFLSLNSANRSFDVLNGPNDVDLRLEAIIANGGLVKSGAGLLQIDNTANTYVGTTEITNGTLRVEGAYTGPTTLTGGTLAGTGTVGVIQGLGGSGRIDPGNFNPIGTLNTGSVNLDALNEFFVDLGAGAFGNDLLAVTGDVDLTDQPELNGTVDPNIQIGDVFTILTATGDITGQFNNAATIVYIDGNKFEIRYIHDEFGPGTQDRIELRRVLVNTTLTMIPSIASPLYGQPFVFNIALTPETGVIPSTTVFVTFQGVTTPITVTNGAAVFNPLANGLLNAGTYTYSASYPGDAVQYGPSSTGSQSIVIQPTNTRTTIQSSLNPAVYGDPVSLAISVTPIAPGGGTLQGTVQIFLNGLAVGSPRTLVDGQAVIALPLPTNAGTYQVTASYTSANGNFTNSTSNILVQTINKDDSATALSASPATTTLGNQVTFTATVTQVGNSYTPTGTVTFRNGTVVLDTIPLVNGVAVYQTSSLNVGVHSISATYNGDINFKTSVGNVTETINRGNTSTALQVLTQGFGFVTLIADVTPVAPAFGVPTGTVTFNISGFGSRTASLDGQGRAVLTVSNIGNGSHTVTATYNGDTRLNTSVANGTIGGPTTTVLTSSDSTSVVGDTVVFTATVTYNPGGLTPVGTVQFFDVTAGGSTLLGTGTLNSSGVATTSVSNFTAGTKLIRAVYTSSGYFDNSQSADFVQQVSAAVTETVLTSNDTTSVFNDPVTFSVIVDQTNGSAVPTGIVSFFDVTTPSAPINLGTRTLVAHSVPGQSTASLTISNLSIGTHQIEARYVSNSFFANSVSNTVTQIVEPATTETLLTSSRNPSAINEPITFTVDVNQTNGLATPTGTVQFFDVTGTPISLGTRTLNGQGMASVTVSNLALGTRQIRAVYTSDSYFQNSQSAILNQVIEQAFTTTTLNSSSTTAVVNDPVTFTAQVALNNGSTVPTGSVSFFDVTNSASPVFLGNRTLNGTGSASLTINTLSQGSHLIRAEYSSNSYFVNSTSNTVTQTINPALTTTTLTSPDGSTAFGDPATFNAQVALNGGTTVPTGTVEFFDVTGSPISLGVRSLNGSGIASLSINTLSIGVHQIRAVYTSNSYFSGSTSNTISQTINQATTMATLSTSSSTSAQNERVTFSVTVAQTDGVAVPTGTVEFRDVTGAPISLGTRTLDAQGQASIDITSLSVGLHQIQAVYTSNSYFVGSTSNTVSQTIDPATTTTTLETTNDDAVFSELVTLTARVVLNNGTSRPTGSVEFRVVPTNESLGSRLVDPNGVATLTLTNRPIGTLQIKAIYTSNSYFVGSESAVVTQTISQAPTTTVLTTSNDSTSIGAPVTFTAQVSIQAPGTAQPTGTVIFRINGQPQPAVPVNASTGRATITLSNLPAGEHTVTAQYNPNPGNFATSTSAPLTQRVTQGTRTTLVSNPNRPIVNQDITFTATVKTSSGGVINSGAVQFVVDGTVRTTVNVNANGVATFVTQLSRGQHTIVANYVGTTSNGASSATLNRDVTQAQSKLVKVLAPRSSAIGDPVTFTFATQAVAPATGIPQGTVQFYVDGILRGSSTVNSAGEASITLSDLARGDRTIKVVYLGSNEFAGSSKTIIHSVTRTGRRN